MACEYKCTSCLIDKKPETAVSFCIVCVEYLCDECMKSHGKYKATRYHKILTGKDIPANTEIYQKLAKSLVCKIHPEREVQLECKDHDEFICALCLRSTHRKCENVEDLDEVKDEIQEDKEKLGLLKNNCREQIKQLVLVKQDKEEKIEGLLREKVICKEERKRLLKEIDKKLEDAVEKEINELIHGTKESIIDCNESEEMREQQYSFLEFVSKYADTKQLRVILTEATKVSIGQIEDVSEPKSYIASTANNVLIKLLEETEVIPGFTHYINNTDELHDGAHRVRLFAENVESEEYTSPVGELNLLNLDNLDKTCNVKTSLEKFISPENQKKKNEDDKAPDSTPNKKKYSLRIEKCKTKSLLDCKLKFVDTFVCEDGLPTGCIVLMDGRIVFIDGKDNNNNGKNGNDSNEDDNSNNKDDDKNGDDESKDDDAGKSDDDDNNDGEDNNDDDGNNSEFDNNANNDDHGESTCAIGTIQVHNDKLDVLFNYDLLHDPCDLCQLESEEIAITYIKEKRIDIFKIFANKIEKVSGFSTSHFCHSITSYNGKLIALCCEEDVNQYIDSSDNDIQIQFLAKCDGQILKVIKEFDSLLKNPFYIEIESEERIILCRDDEVDCFYVDGNLQSCFRCYKQEKVKEINCMAIDNEGNLYVCGGMSIYQMRAGNLEYSRLLHKMENICEASWIAFDEKKERLIVGFENDRIKLYNFV